MDFLKKGINAIFPPFGKEYSADEELRRIKQELFDLQARLLVLTKKREVLRREYNG